MMVSDGAVRSWLATPFAEADARFSPDARWVAYTSNESGRPEVFVRGFPEGDAKTPISVNGGWGPVWRADGRELYYVSPDNQLMAVSVTPEMRFETGTPTALFTANVRTFRTQQQYDVSHDGQQFFLIRNVVGETDTPFVVVQNWIQ